MSNGKTIYPTALWEKIKFDFVHRNMSVKELSEKYPEVPYKTLWQRADTKGWKQEKKELQLGIQEKLKEELYDDVAEKHKEIQKKQEEHFSEVIETAMNDFRMAEDIKERAGAARVLAIGYENLRRSAGLPDRISVQTNVNKTDKVDIQNQLQDIFLKHLEDRQKREKEINAEVIEDEPEMIEGEFQEATESES